MPAPQCPPFARGGLASETKSSSEQSVYTAAFWIAYVANVAVVAANSLTFRFAELVDFLGGKEQVAGLIVGVATFAALLSRLGLGQALDRYGVRRLWIAASLTFLVGGGLLTFVHRLDWTLYAARGVFAIGVAGMITCSTVHIQNLVPPHRRTEVIGSLGSSGFIGMICGAVIGDVVFAYFGGAMRYSVLFGIATLIGCAYLVLVLLLTRGQRHARPAETPALHLLVRRYWPGNVMLVAFAMGTMLAVTTVFLTRFATHRGLAGLGPFFGAYSVSAFTFRLVSRHWSHTVGRHRMILLGLGGHCVAMLLLPFVHREWHFIVPALLGGFGHALLFPAVVSLGSEPFPLAYRGTATTLVLGFFEVGLFVSAPLLGWVIDAFEAGFTQMFLCAAVVAAGVAVIYQLTSARRPDADYVGRAAGSGGWFAGGVFASRSLLLKPFARRTSAEPTSACESFAPEDSARSTVAGDTSRHELSAPTESAPKQFAREGSKNETPAGEVFAAGKSARGGTAATSAASPHRERVSATSATRCR